MKPEVYAARIGPALALMRCPLCGGGLCADGGSLRCENGHCYDISSRGYVNLAPGRDQSAEKYGAELFESRREVFDAGFYQPVLQAVLDVLGARFGDAPFALADAGCGEGYYSRGIMRALPLSTVFGIDLSRDAILCAARSSAEPLWMVADLKRLPVKDGALDAVLDVLTPADYTEYSRALKPGGELIKLFPGEDYLREIRAALGGELRSEGLDGARVLEHLKTKARITELIELRYTRPLTPSLSRAFLRMTPMTFSVPGQRLDDITLDEITVHLRLARCLPE